MRRNILYFMIFAAALAAGCKKPHEEQPVKGPVEIVANVPEDALLFNVKLDTKSHFADDASTTSGETANLVWDASDDIGVYALHMNEAGDDMDLTDVKCGLAKIKTINPDGSATFYSTEAEENWWMKEGDENDDSPYIFVAYYPANGEKHPFEKVAEFTDGGDVERIYSPIFTIPSSQNGKSWAGDQVLMSLDIATTYSRKDLLEKASTVTFSAFKPLTTLFQFRLMSGMGSAEDNIDKITLSLKSREKSSSGGGSTSYINKNGETVYVEWPQRYYYSTDYAEDEELNYFIGLAGTGILSLFVVGDPDNLALMPLNGQATADDDDYVHPGITITQQISLDFEAPVTIPAAIDEAEMYSMVVAPILDGFFWRNDRSNAVLLFEAWRGEEVVLVAEKQIPAEGFKPGYRYNFNLAMGVYSEMTGTDAGSYSDVVSLEQ